MGDVFAGHQHYEQFGAQHVKQFLTYLEIDRQVLCTTQNEAISVILFLYLDVLQVCRGNCIGWAGLVAARCPSVCLGGKGQDLHFVDQARQGVDTAAWLDC